MSFLELFPLFTKIIKLDFPLFFLNRFCFYELLVTTVSPCISLLHGWADRHMPPRQLTFAFKSNLMISMSPIRTSVLKAS